MVLDVGDVYRGENGKLVINIEIQLDDIDLYPNLQIIGRMIWI